MASSAEHIVVQVTAARRDQAERIAEAAVERRLAASGQVEPLRTWYRWRGQVREAEEHRVSLFTRAERFEAIAQLVTALHDYELPQIVAVPLCEGTPRFLRWIDRSCELDSEG